MIANVLLHCRHLDLDGDGYISVDEVEALLAELGVPKSASEQASGVESQSSIPLTSSGVSRGATNKITFAQFLQLHRQVYITPAG